MSLEDCIKKHYEIARSTMENYDEQWVEKYREFWKDLFNEWRTVKSNPKTRAKFFEELVDELISKKGGKKHHFLNNGEYIIDPFTIIYSLHATSLPRKIRIRKKGKVYELPPGSGQPSAPKRNKYFFDPHAKPKYNMVSELWEFGERIFKYKTISDLLNDITFFTKKFNDVLDLKYVGISKKVFCPYDTNAKVFSKSCSAIPKEKDIKKNPETYVKEYLKKIHNLNLYGILNGNAAKYIKYKTVWFSEFIYKDVF